MKKAFISLCMAALMGAQAQADVVTINDDISAGIPRPIVINVETPAVVEDKESGQDFKVYGSIVSEFEDPSVVGDVTLVCDNETLTVSNSRLLDGACEFEFTTTHHVMPQSCATVEVKATSTGGYTASATQNIWSSWRPVVVEEFTGTWCSWCVRGIVYIEAMKGEYGDMFIPLCVHRQDVMTVPEYYDAVDYLSDDAIPNAIVNRIYECDPSALLRWFAEASTDGVQVAITALDVQIDDQCKKVDAEVKVAFVTDIYDEEFSVAYVLTEDNVHHPDDHRYAQMNGYAGWAAGRMGGFEDRPAVIAPYDMFYNDVVRGVSTGGPQGVPNSLPGEIKAGAEYTHQYTFEIPDNVDSVYETSLVVLVIYNYTNEILNARKVSLGDLCPDALADIEVSDTDVNVYNLQGMWLGSYPSVEAFRQSAPANGIYITRTANQTQKLTIN